jgi:hypothetical protein
MTDLTPTAPSPAGPYRIAHERATALIRRRRVCSLATVSERGVPHVANVIYAVVGEELWVNTVRTSRKARNVAHGGRAAVCIAVRRLPVGPPSSLHFQARCEVVAIDDPRARRLVDEGQLRSITSHGELELPGSCFVRIARIGRINAYGIGMPLHRLARDPLHAAGVVADPPTVVAPTA